MSKKPRILSGIQPTSQIHIGNYFGAINNWVALQESQKFDCFYGVVDLHAITMPFDPALVRKNTEEMVIDLLACGIDPEKSTLFVQSMVPEHAELSWILGCVTSYGELSRMTQFKDKSEQYTEQRPGDFISAGLFTYPILQAADILIYLANYVPVGKDQEQHLELSRNIAQRFNNRFGEFFPIPATKLTETPKIMSTADPDKKMSSSLGEKHFIGLFENEDSIRNKIKTAVTDTGPNVDNTYDEMSPGVGNLFTILNACGKNEDAEALLKEYKNGNLKYVNLKDAVATALVELTKPLIEKREGITGSEGDLRKKMINMSEKARIITRETMRGVRERVGLA